MSQQEYQPQRVGGSGISGPSAGNTSARGLIVTIATKMVDHLKSQPFFVANPQLQNELEKMKDYDNFLYPFAVQVQSSKTAVTYTGLISEIFKSYNVAETAVPRASITFCESSLTVIGKIFHDKIFSK